MNYIHFEDVDIDKIDISDDLLIKLAISRLDCNSGDTGFTSKLTSNIMKQYDFNWEKELFPGMYSQYIGIARLKDDEEDEWQVVTKPMKDAQQCYDTCSSMLLGHPTDFDDFKVIPFR